MEYRDFEREFMRRTLRLVREYNGPYDATFLLNCLLGLLIVPAQTSLDDVPESPVSSLAEWGISPSSVIRFGSTQQGVGHPQTLRQLVKSLRNSVAHFRFEPVYGDGQVAGFIFSDLSGFEAHISLADIRGFVEKLSAHLDSRYGA